MPRTTRKLISLTVSVLVGSALAAGCGVGSGSDLGSGVATLKVLYRAESQNQVTVFETIKDQLAQVDIDVEGIPESNVEYTEMISDPAQAQAGRWDVAIAARSNDGADDAGSFLAPLAAGSEAFPPAGSNFGLYENPETTAFIDAGAWEDADRQVMTDAAIYPIAEPKQALYAATGIKNRVYIPAFQNYDPTVVKKAAGPRADSLYLLGAGDVDTMDPNLSYYSIGYLSLRMWSRQLYAFSSNPSLPALDLAVDRPTPVPVTLDDGTAGTAFTIVLRDKATWNSSPVRPVTGSDVVRGVKRSCNPVAPFGGLERYRDLIEGFAAFCAGFAELGPTASVDEIRSAVDVNVAGLQANANSVRITFREANMSSARAMAVLALPAFSPAPVEFLNDLPGQLRPENRISNGPYRVQSYIAGEKIVFVQNQAWRKVSDPVREQEFEEIVVDETHVNQSATQKLLQAARSNADLAWDSFVPRAAVAGLVESRDPNLAFRRTFALDPYLVFNTSTASVLGDVEVRRALSTALSRDQFVAALGGDDLNVPLNHVLPVGLQGSQALPDFYRYDPVQAKATLAELLKN